MTKHQHGFTKGRSVLTNMLSFLKEIYEALDNDSNAEIVAVYTDFAKAFDKVPHFDLLRKVALICAILPDDTAQPSRDRKKSD